MREICLAFYCYPRKGAVPDFEDVARRIEAQTDDIAARVFVTNASAHTLFSSLALVSRPTVTIEMDRVKFARILRGHRLRHHLLGKFEEMRALAEAGIPVPRTVKIEPDTVLDPNEWGPYIVTKPDFGKRGAWVWIHRTHRVRYKAPSSLTRDHYGREGMIAQQFIYTGRYPVAHRIVTYFGRVILAIRYDGRRDRRPLEGPTEFGKGGGHNIVAPAMGCQISEIADPDILDLARRAHSAFPEIPSLGVDIVRDAETGKLFVLETNPYGDSWSLTTDSGAEMQKQFGLDFHAQFNALDAITEASIEMARRYAR